MSTSNHQLTMVAAVVGPLLLLASTIAYLVNGDGLSKGSIPGAIQVWAFIALTIATVGLARRLEDAAPRLATALTAISVIGGVGGALYGLDSIQVAVLKGSIHESAVSPVALRIPGVFFPMALIGLGWFLVRKHLVPPTAGYGLMVSGILFPASRVGDIGAIAIACDVILVMCLAAIVFSSRTAGSRSSIRGAS